MKKMILLVMGACLSMHVSFGQAAAKKAVIAYIFGTYKPVDAALVDPSQITHVNYAFVNIKDGKAYLEKPENDTANFHTLNLLKKQNPALKILISVGGWTWSKHFSDVSLTASSRKIFAKSAAAIVEKYKLDGIDIDWEYPGLRGDNNTFRPEDKTNYTLLFKALRNELDHLKSKYKKDYLLTTATGGFLEFLTHTEMYNAQQYLDYINIMTYDFRTQGDTIAGHHTNLFHSPYSNKISSANQAVREHIAAGVPPHKIVVGIAFYGRAWKTAGIVPDGLHDKVAGAARGGGYTKLKDSIVNQNGYVRHWDEKAKAPYLYNKETNIFISYDDELSVKEKCRYVNTNGLGGVMFWEYFSDPKRYLLAAINEEL